MELLFFIAVAMANPRSASHLGSGSCHFNLGWGGVRSISPTFTFTTSTQNLKVHKIDPTDPTPKCNLLANNRLCIR